MRTGPGWLQKLAAGPLLCDGGMGTQLILRGLPSGVGADLWTLENPNAVREVHEAYVAAGCDFVTTNTFGASRMNIERQGEGVDAYELNLAAAQLAREAAGDRAFVLGDIGPYGGFLEPVGDDDPDQVLESFMEQSRALEAGGADGIIIETMADPVEAKLAIEAARGGTGLPVISTFAFDAGPAYRTMMGATVEAAIKTALDAGASVVGANCGTGMSLEDYAVLADQVVRAAGGAPVIMQPNAGAPQMVDGKLTYVATPEQMSSLAPRLLASGVRILGGCCGTSPAHLAAIRNVVIS